MARATGSRLRTTPRRVVCLALLVVSGVLGSTAPGLGEEPTEVKVERVKPRKDKHPTLQFLKENRGFIRARYDLVRQRLLDQRGEGGAIDPRYLAYQKMLAEILAAKDSVQSSEEERQRRALLESVTQIGALESQLDLLERQLAAQRLRLGVLQNDFAGDQRTALMVVVSGYPGRSAVSEVAIALEDGATLSIPLTPEHQESLRKGGVVQLFHGFIEPREQVLEIAISGDRWPSGDAGYLTLEPTRDRLTLLRLDLSNVHPEEGATGIRASTWLHEARTPTGDG